jgi:hypothetical protein
VVDAELSKALEPILHDLRIAGCVLPTIADEPWTDDPEQPSCMLYEPDGSGAGASIHRGLPLPAQVAALADQVQDWAVEALWAAGRSTSWPQCPDHPDSHPLTAVNRADRAVWSCPVTGDEIVGIGFLGEQRID